MAHLRIVGNIQAGNLGDVENDVKTLVQTENKFPIAGFIIIKVCIITSKRSSIPQKDITSLKNICTLCLQAIIRDKAGDVIDVDQRLTAALYHIARVIIENDDYEAFAEVISASLPVLESMPNANDPKQVNTLVMFTNFISDSYKKLVMHLSKCKDADIESGLFSFWEILLRMSNLSRQNLHVVFYLASRIVTFHGQKVGVAKKMVEFQDQLVSSLKNFFVQNDLHMSDAAKLIKMSVFAATTFFRNLTTMKEFDSAIKVLKDMIEILKAVFSISSPEGKAIQVIDKTLSPFLFSFNVIPSSGIQCTELLEALLLFKEAAAEGPKESKALEWAAFAISSVMSSLKPYWIQDIEKAKSVISASILPPLEDIFSELATILKRSSCSLCLDPAGQPCPLREDIPCAFYLEYTVIYLAGWVINWDADARPMLLKACENSLRQCEDLASIATKKHCFKSAELMLSMCESTYTVAIKNMASPLTAKELLEKSRDFYLQYCKASKEILPRKTVAIRTLKVLTSVLVDLKETTSACEAVAIALALQFSSSEKTDDFSLLKLWGDLVSLPNEHVSLLAFLKSNKAAKDFFDGNYASAINWDRIFVVEMMALGSYGTHKFSALRKCWEARKGLNLTSLQKIKSALSFVSAVAFCEDVEPAKEFMSNFKIKDYHSLLQFTSSCEQPIALCELAQLSHFQFFIAKRIHQQASTKLVEAAKTFKPLPKKVLSMTDVVDQNDVCDLTPTIANLTVSQEVPLLSYLDTAVRYWDESLKKGLGAELLNSLELQNCAQRLTEAALLYRLFGHYMKEKRAWEVCFNFGQQVRNDPLMLRAISGLMDLSCCDPGWVQRGHAIAATLVDEQSAQKVLHIFRNSVIVHCFLNQKEEEGAHLLKEVLKAEDKWTWYHIKSKFLLARYLLDTPRSLRTTLFPEEYENPFGIVRDCFSRTKHLVDSKKTIGGQERRFEILDHYSVANLLFSVVFWLGYTYTEMMLPREARCFLKTQLVIAQKMGLAIRTAECLSLLGKVDALVQKIEDTVVKVEGIKQILDVEMTDGEDPFDEIPVFQDEEDKIRVQYAPITGNQTGASPNLPNSRFTMPEFASHKPGCPCYYCTHILLHKLWLDMGLIQASAYASQLQVRLAKNFFINTIKLAEICRAKQEKLLNGFSGRAAVLEDFIRSETALRLGYADFLILDSKENEKSWNAAWEVNKSLFTFLDKVELKDKLLLTDAREQKISLIDIGNSKDLSQAPVKRRLETSLHGRANAAAVTPDVLSKQPSNFLTVKTPLPSKVPREGARTPLEPITPQYVIPIKEKAFIQGRGVIAPVFNISDSDDEDSSAQCAAALQTVSIVDLEEEEGRRIGSRKKEVGKAGDGGKGDERKECRRTKTVRKKAVIKEEEGKEDGRMECIKKEDGRREGDKKTKSSGKTCKGKELGTSVKSASATASTTGSASFASAGVKINTQKATDLEDDDIGDTDFIDDTVCEGDVEVLSQYLVTPRSQVTRPSRRIPEEARNVKDRGASGSDDDIQIVPNKAKVTRSAVKVGSSDVQTDKPKTKKTASAPRKTNGSSIPVRSTRSRRI